MNKEEYIEKLKKLKECHNSMVNDLKKEYAMSNNEIKAGDFVTSIAGVTILVDTINFGTYGYTDLPECVYKGVRHTKRAMPYKSGEREVIWQSQIKKEE